MMCPTAPAVNRLCIALAGILSSEPASAHVSEMGFVLLLPTELYIGAGVWTVALTAVILSVAPWRWTARLLSPYRVDKAPLLPNSIVTSTVSALFMFAMIACGILGARDPLVNPLPLVVWTVWWVLLLLLPLCLGDIWRWINPWNGPAYWCRRWLGLSHKPRLRLAPRLGYWPACVGLLLFAAFALADPAPDDPDRLALFVFGYWAAILPLVVVFGEPALNRLEFFSALSRLVAGLAPFRLDRNGIAVGFPGWRLVRRRRLPPSLGALALAALAIGSFDGLNETFLWLAWIDVNPLLLPGRSALIEETLVGLGIAIVGLFAIFGLASWTGMQLARGGRLGDVFGNWAIATLPIAVAYHFAHYLVITLVNLQYLLAAFSDPMAIGADYLGLGTYYVTTGFLNRPAPVRLIFEWQAAAVVVGHVLAVVLAHHRALEFYQGDRWRAFASQLPLAVFMILYTFFGLWLLATPKGA